MKVADVDADRAMGLIPLKSESILAVYANLICAAELPVKLLEAPARREAKAISQRSCIQHSVDQSSRFLMEPRWDRSMGCFVWSAFPNEPSCVAAESVHSA